MATEWPGKSAILQTLSLPISLQIILRQKNFLLSKRKIYIAEILEKLRYTA